MNYIEILEEQKAIAAKVEKAKADTLAYIQKAIEDLGFTAEDIFPPKKSFAEKYGTGSCGYNKTLYEKNKRRYLHPSNGKSWDGYSYLPLRFWNVEVLPKALQPGFTHTPKALRLMADHGVGNDNNPVAKAFTEAQITAWRDIADQWDRLLKAKNKTVLKAKVKETSQEELTRILQYVESDTEEFVLKI